MNFLKIPVIRSLAQAVGWGGSESDRDPVDYIEVCGNLTLDHAKDILYPPPPKIYIDHNNPDVLHYVDAYRWPDAPRPGIILHVGIHKWLELEHEYAKHTGQYLTHLEIHHVHL